MITYTPQNWPAGAPAYDSPEGWEYQKMLARKAALTTASTIPYLIKRNNFLALVVAARLAEIVEHEDAEYIRQTETELQCVARLHSRTVGNYEERLNPLSMITRIIFRDESNA